jgi:hypothetical protein
MIGNADTTKDNQVTGEADQQGPLDCVNPDERHESQVSMDERRRSENEGKGLNACTNPLPTTPLLA